MNINTSVKDSGKITSAPGIFAVNKTIYLYYHSSQDPDNVLRIAESTDGINFQLSSKVSDYRLPDPEFKFQEEFNDQNEEIEAELEMPNGSLILSHVKNPDNFQVFASLYNSKSKKLLWKTNIPVWQSPGDWNISETSFIGLVYFNYKIFSYWKSGDSIHLVAYSNFKTRDPQAAKHYRVQLEKHHQNPILTPNPKNSWEAFNTFNPAALYLDGKVHLLYRAQGFDYVSVVGYASSPDGIHIDNRLNEPAYLPTESFEYTGKIKPKQISHMYVSGGGFGGVEDPRATVIDGRVYMTYVAFDGISPPRSAITSIKMDDFLSHRWLWERPVLITPPNIVDKSTCIFPEKINGKYVILHRVFPDILIDFVDSLSFDGSTWLEGQYKISPRPGMWDSRKIGAGAPPLKTESGWLLIYQAVDDRDDKRYKVGAMLLDLDDPTRVLHRSRLPILEPMEHYENNGFKPGIVYPCGAVIVKDTLFVYYGGADSYVCVATANLKEFLAKLQYTENPRLEPATLNTLPAWN